MTHASVAGTELEVPGDLIRLSVGIEDVEDLIADLREALDILTGEPAVPPPARASCASTSGRPSPRRRSSTPRRAPSSAPPSHPTTVSTDVMDGVDAVRRRLGGVRRAHRGARLLQSAGGGLRLAVVGYERTVTAEAGQRVGLSAGAKVVHVASGALGHEPSRHCGRPPDIVLLVGGTDGGNADRVAAQ
jgi:hypothetical protein